MNGWLIDLNRHYVMPNFYCGGTAVELQTFSQVQPQIIADCLGSKQWDNLCSGDLSNEIGL